VLVSGFYYYYYYYYYYRSPFFSKGDAVETETYCLECGAFLFVCVLWEERGKGVNLLLIPTDLLLHHPLLLLQTPQNSQDVASSPDNKIGAALLLQASKSPAPLDLLSVRG